MLRSVFRRPSPAAVLALLVLVVIAAPLANAAQDAVRSPQAARAAKSTKKSSVVAHAKFADNAQKVRGYSVGFAALPSRIVLTGPNGKLPAAAIPAGTQGPQGVPGPTGPKGSGFGQVRITFVTGTAGTSGVADATAACNSDEKVTGGGYEIIVPTHTGQSPASERGTVTVTQDKPVVVDQAAGTSGWYVQAVRTPPEINISGTTVTANSAPPAIEKLVQVKAWAVCAK